MIPPSLPHLHALHAAACDALRATGATSALSFASDLREVHGAACRARVELYCALSVAGKAGAFVAVERIVRPAIAALTALCDAIIEERETQREVERAG